MLALATVAAFVAACVFFGVAAFSATLGDVPLIPAGLFSLAIGLTLIYVVPKLQALAPERQP